jgi:photosystem II stability/assembly factor-like uncharacterized protein
MVGAVSDGGKKWNGIVWFTSDRGANWTRRCVLTSYLDSTLIGVRFTNAKRGWALAWAGISDGSSRSIILSTDDGGLTWKETLSVAEVLYGLAITEEGHLWVTGEERIWFTPDDGKSWQKTWDDRYDTFFGLAVTNKGRIWAVGDEGNLLSSETSGKEWASRSLPPGFTDTWLGAVCFTDDMHGWTVGNNGFVFATADGGWSWEIESKGSSGFLRKLVATSKNIFAVGDDGTIMIRGRD